MRSGGGWAALRYSLRKARESGGILNFYKRMRARNACKTCAVGMGGQLGGMRNESGGNALEVCKKSFQAQAADMMPPIPAEFLDEHSHAELLRWDHKQLEDAGRIGFPMLYEEGARHWRRISWKEALQRAGDALRATPPQRSVFYSSGRSSNEAAYLLQCFARVYGTNNISNCSYYCHQASGVGLGMAVGSGTATVTHDDLEHADFALVVGANPASNHPRLITRLVDIRKRGGSVVIVNPLREIGLVRFRIPSRLGSMLFGSQVSDVYVQPHIGGDIAFLKGVAKHLLQRDALDRDFITNSTTGFEAVARDLEEARWDDLETASGVRREVMHDVGERYARAERAMFLWAMGVTQHVHGVQNVLAITNLAMMRGMLGRPNAGLLPIRGHSNVQGVGSVGVTPALKEAFAQALQNAYGIQLPKERGLDTFESLEAMGAGKVDTAIYLGGNLFSASPDPAWAARCMQSVGTAVYISTKLNPGHFHGRGKTTLILPARTRDEESQATTQESMFNYVRLSEGGAVPVSAEMRSEVDIVASLAARVLPREPIDWERWKDHATLRREMARVVPGFGKMGEIDTTRREFTIDGRIRHEPRFATADGRAHFHVTPVPEFPLRDSELRLMTMRSEGQFNTVIYEYEDIYRGTDGRDVVLMHADDAAAMGFAADEPVMLESDAGTYGPVRVFFAPIRRGNLAVYYPEANVLVPRTIDPSSRTPVFKSVAVRVTRAPNPAMASSATVGAT